MGHSGTWSGDKTAGCGDQEHTAATAGDHPQRVDGEYTRHGTASLFMVCEPLAGRRHVFVRAQRKRADFAAVIQTLCDELYPPAEKIVLVLDQLNTHDVASLYAAFPPQEARRLAQRLESHHTPKHGSWLNMAE